LTIAAARVEPEGGDLSEFGADVEKLAKQAIETGACVDVAKMAAERRTEREMRWVLQWQVGR
jgi:hypothetical protein